MAKKKDDSNDFDFNTMIEHIIEREIDEACTEYQCIFGANKNLYRYIPSVVDGLKPVQRRALYAMWVNNVTGPNNRKKLNQVNGYTVDYHPHGDASVGDVVVNMGQVFNNLIPYVVCHGNEGSQKGDTHAAPRYLEVWLSEFGIDCFFKDYKWSNIDVKEAYTGSTTEPETLPTKYPVALLNGYFSSIGYTLSSNIPPYNFKDLCEATINLINNPKAKIKIYPDSPTGCQIVYTEDLDRVINEINPDGFKLQMKSDIDIDYVHNIINITSLPMQVTADAIRVKLAGLCKDGKIPLKGKNDKNTSAIRDIQDDTRKNDINMHIILHPDANPDEVLEDLYKKLDLKKTYNMSITLIDDYKTRNYSVRSFLLEWIDYRRDLLRSSYNANFVKAMEDEHMNNVKIMVSDEKNAKKTIQLCTESENAEEFAKKLIAYYGITSLQAKVISRLSVTGFLREAHKRYLEDAKILRNEIESIQKILDNPKKIDERIIEDLKYGISKFGAPRRSKIVNPDEDLVDESYVIGISEDGYIKKILADGSSIGSISKNSGQMNMAIQSTSKDVLMIFDQNGFMHFVKVSDLPSFSGSSTGILLSKITEIQKGSKIVSVLKCPIGKINLHGDESITFISGKGNMKRTLLSNLLKENSLHGKKKVIQLADGDSLVCAIYTVDPKVDIIVYTNLGDGIRINLSDIPLLLPTSKGNNCMSVRKMEIIENARVIDSKDEYLVYITQNGKVKKTELKLFPCMKKKDPSLPLINLDSGDRLLSIISAQDGDRICCYRKLSGPVDIKVKEIPVSTRIAKADKLMKLPKGDSVVASKLER